MMMMMITKEIVKKKKKELKILTAWTWRETLKVYHNIFADAQCIHPLPYAKLIFRLSSQFLPFSKHPVIQEFLLNFKCIVCLEVIFLCSKRL